MPESEEDVDMGGLFGADDDYDDEFSYEAPSKAQKSAPKMYEIDRNNDKLNTNNH